MEGKLSPKKLSLEEFKKTTDSLPKGLEFVLDQINGGTFMQCHKKMFEQTGIWIPELVPVFQKLDATLMSSERLPKDLVY